MNAERLLEHFDRLSEAPAAVSRLRRFILGLAVRGKLVKQDQHDEPAVKFLSGRAIQVDATGWTLPPGWEWSNLSLLGEAYGGGTPNKSEATYWVGKIPWVSPKDMKVELIGDSEDHISEEAIQKSSARLISSGAILMVVRGMILAHSFPLAISTVDLTINQDMKAILPFHARFAPMLKLILKGMTPQILRMVHRSTHGTCKLLTNELLSLPLPIPPIAEQHRIVAKVDELMALCDRLEEAQQRRETCRAKLTAASLARLNQPTAEPEFRDHVRFHLQHFPRCTTTPDQIRQLRQTILNLAVRGKLVEQDVDNIVPVALEKAAKLQNGYAFKSDWFVPEGIRLLRNANVGHSRLCWSETVCLSEDRLSEFVRFKLNMGDIVLSLDRPFIATGTKVARICSDDLPSLLLQRVGRFQIDFEQLCADYLFLWLTSSDFSSQVDAGRSNGVPHISSRQVEATRIRIPPLTEQQRIVAKVDELMGICDQLEAQLVTTQTVSRRLLDAVLQDVLSASATHDRQP